MLPRINGRQFFVSEALTPGRTLTLSKDLTHRLAKVLRLSAGETIHLCDSQTGRYTATLGDACKTAHIDALQSALPENTPTIHLWLGLPKREAMESAFRQATELGVSGITPILTRYSVPTKLNEERAASLLTEAAEQCERLTLPTLAPLTKLEHALKEFSGKIYWADESSAGANTKLSAPSSEPIAVLVGPEGGFSPEEKALLTAAKNVHPIALGSTILRTDTAVVAALAKVLL